jgi:hypothetical protein
MPKRIRDSRAVERFQGEGRLCYNHCAWGRCACFRRKVLLISLYAQVETSKLLPSYPTCMLLAHIRSVRQRRSLVPLSLAL